MTVFQECSFILAPLPSCFRGGLLPTLRSLSGHQGCVKVPDLSPASPPTLQQCCSTKCLCGPRILRGLIHSFSPFIVPKQPRGQCLSPCTNRIIWIAMNLRTQGNICRSLTSCPRRHFNYRHRVAQLCGNFICQEVGRGTTLCSRGPVTSLPAPLKKCRFWAGSPCFQEFFF